MMDLKGFLKKINSLPMSFTIKHYYAFGKMTPALKDQKLDSGESWDVLRLNHPDFSISSNREEWLKACEGEIKKDGQDTKLKERAEDITKLLKSLKIKHLFSAGSGGAGLEYQIKKIMPELDLTCSEYSQINIGLLKKVFWECNHITTFNIKNNHWPEELKNESHLCLIYRVDASFTNAEWRKVFENLYDSEVKYVLYIPTNFLTLLSFFIRLLRRIGWRIKGRHFAFAGYLRTKKTFQNFWQD